MSYAEQDTREGARKRDEKGRRGMQRESSGENWVCLKRSFAQEGYDGLCQTSQY
jgi:hypothetical protein